jgi:hypothetical protein
MPICCGRPKVFRQQVLDVLKHTNLTDQQKELVQRRYINLVEHFSERRQTIQRL